VCTKACTKMRNKGGEKGQDKSVGNEKEKSHFIVAVELRG